MPIYSYKCSNCGYTKDVLQKYSDAPITHCPKCNMKTMVKQLSAPGFELKGKGWYATDFKGGSSAALPASPSLLPFQIPRPGAAAPMAAPSAGQQKGRRISQSPGGIELTLSIKYYL